VLGWTTGPWKYPFLEVPASNIDRVRTAVKKARKQLIKSKPL